MRRIGPLTLLSTIALVGRAEAANLAVLAQPPNMVNAVVLLFAVGCIVIGFQVQSVVRGGLLSKGWQLFLVGFICLAISQLLALLLAAEVIALPSFAVPAGLVLMGVFFLFGLVHTKRTLG